MARKPQYLMLVEYLRVQPGNCATIKQAREDLWIQNLQDAAMKARKKGFNITTEYDKDNPKIAYYQLHEEPKVTFGSVPLPPSKQVYEIKPSKGPLRLEMHKTTKKEWDKMQAPLFPTNQRHYE